MEDKDINKIEKKVAYISALFSLILFAFNIFIFRYTGSFLFILFAGFWAIEGILDLAKDGTDDINDLMNK